jgi:PmbA protein
MNTKKWIELGISKGLTDVEIYVSESSSLKLVSYEGKIEQNTISDVSTVSIRGVYEGNMGKVKFEFISDDQVDKMLDKVIENAQVITVKEPAIIFEGSPSYPEVKVHDFDFSSIPMTKKVEDLITLETKIRSNEKVSNVQTAVYQENTSGAILTNSKGLHLTRKNRFAYAYGVGVFKEGEDITTAYEFDIFKTYDSFDPNQLADITIEKGLKKLGATSLPTKFYPVVFSNETFSDLISVFSGLYSLESAYRHLTPYEHKVGEAIAQSNFNLIDDPLHEKAYFQVPFDDEGVACKKKYIIKDGVFQGFINDLKMASMFKLEPSGNSFSGNIQTTNLYLEPGKKSFDALIETINDGVYITELVGLHAGVKAISGEFSLQASGFKIEDGKVSFPVNMIVVSGNFFEVMNSIEEFANDLKFDTSGFGSPSVHVKSLSISGETK